MGEKSLKIAMFPWFAMGHLTPFLHVSNKLARKGHNISFFIPKNTQHKLEPFNRFPELISFVPITVPHVDGLPPGTETTSDVPFPLHPHVMTAMDRTEPDIKRLLIQIKPDCIFFDFTHWIPALARQLRIKSILYCVISAATVGYTLVPARQNSDIELTVVDLIQPPVGYPISSIKLHAHEAKAYAAKRSWKFGSDILFYKRHFISFSQCDAIGFKTSREIEGPLIEYIETQFDKPVFLSEPGIPEQPKSSLEPKWAEWLIGFQAGEVIYCAFGSECTLRKDQLQELLLGFELSGFPFVAALRQPMGTESIEAAMPEGFEERVRGRGVVHGGWVQQQLILQHSSVGCFVTHCGSGSLSEALVNECQLVLLPNVGDQIINARLMGDGLEVGVEVERGEEDGLFTKESVCKAVKSVMDEKSEVGKKVRENHAKLRKVLLGKDLESNYIDSFSKSLQDLVG